MEWTADVSVGDWLRERIDDPWQGTMHDVVPRGFDAYARVFHPASRDRPVGAQWPREPYSDHRVWSAFQTAHPDLEVIDEAVSWAATATAMGTTMHPGAQWSKLVRFDPYADRENDPRDAEGWRYQDPEQGGMPAATLASLATVLAAHTSTPGDGFVALWEGRGGLLGFIGDAPSRGFYSWQDGAPTAHNDMLGRSIKDRFNNVFRKASWQDGILSREISEGPRLHLPDRAYVLFRGAVTELTEPDWVRRVPWRDLESEGHGFPPDAQTPGILWPVDRAWVSVTEVDYDSTIVGGSAELVAALIADPRLEVLEIPEGRALHLGADEVNR